MKHCGFAALAATSLLVSCESISTTLNEPITSDYDPLDGPGVRLRSEGGGVTTAAAGPAYQPGQWVEAAMPNTTFFRRYPKGSATADRILKTGTPVKVVSTRGSHVKVELENGEVGYVPSIMVAEPTLSGQDSTPFLPEPPNSPLHSAPPSLPDAAPAPLQDTGDSVIPPPSNFSPAPVEPLPEPDDTNEVLIPTSPPEAPALPESSSTSFDDTIPPPSNLDNLDPSFGIE
ncbi:MAG: hypothetical protein Q7Q71_14340 [Verrucomicrobiota bacterium JB023]|nr:hypothetical protein [Verrucomicrobiota bacterium JB023]